MILLASTDIRLVMSPVVNFCLNNTAGEKGTVSMILLASTDIRLVISPVVNFFLNKQNITSNSCWQGFGSGSIYGTAFAEWVDPDPN